MILYHHWVSQTKQTQTTVAELLEDLGRTSLVMSEPTLALYLCRESESPESQAGFGRPAELGLHKIGPRDRLCGSCHWQEEQENQHKCSLPGSFPSADEVEVGHFNCKGCSEHKEVK